MNYIYITKVPLLAKYAEEAGVDRVMVDLEIMGKLDRQKGLNTLISGHTLDDVAAVRGSLSRAKLMTRINPIHDGTEREISDVIGAGAESIMLPMFRSVGDAVRFTRAINGRAQSCLLFETPAALVRMNEIIDRAKPDEVFLGLNDLHLALGLDFMFELLSGGIVEMFCANARARGLRYGFGGVSRVGLGKVDASLILGEHVRLGSEMCFLTREFHGAARSVEELERCCNFSDELRRLRSVEAKWRQSSGRLLDENSKALKTAVYAVLDRR